MPRVLVLVRQGCHLCDQALEVVAAVCAETGDDYTTQDIDSVLDDITLTATQVHD